MPPEAITENDMSELRGRYQLASDNTAGICPEVLAAIEEANADYASPYGDDGWTGRVRDQVRELFETDCEIYFASSGTAANALALAQICHSFHSIICHQNAHLQTDECGAPEFFTSGSKLLLIGGSNGKIDLEQAEATIRAQPELHAHKPRAISLTQATELGTTYRPDEIVAASGFAKRHQLVMHMDGARFANAVATVGCRPRELSWQAGVDILCFGGTKNGSAGAELIVFFEKRLALAFDYRLKQAGQLPAKMRFLAAQWAALLRDKLWLRNARHANRMAALLAEQLRSKANMETLFPIESNAVFLRLEDKILSGLRKHGWRFYDFLEPGVFRFMCSWSTSEADVDRFVSDVVCIRRGPSV